MADESVDTAPHRSAVARDRANILGCLIDRVDMEQTLAWIDAGIEEGRFAQHMAVNAAKLVAMEDDPTLRAAVEQSELVTADGQAIVWASRLLGDPLPARVAGIDLMHRVLDLAERKAYRVYVLGARSEVIERAMGRLREVHPQLRVAGYRDGYFEESQDAAVAEKIGATRPDILLVAISSPRKEYFLDRHGRTLGASFVMGVGGSIDIVAGITRRAPVWMQRAGLEWAFRLVQEPRRLFRRYFLTNTRFIALVLRDVLVRRRSDAGS
jgi:N-acetylglucosaminyldiphosphoundecaprenol N-acetyl-beta-D-mannosaminyltransferase